MSNLTGMHCPAAAHGDDERIQLAHGEGGRLMRNLLRQSIVPSFSNEFLQQGGDAAVLPPLTGPLVFTTDSYVVTPLVFPGGDIGSLSVYGTANDLAVAGARPQWISLGMIIEEGFSVSLLEQILHSIARASEDADVQVVTGDTKVVPRGAADGLFLNTAGVGERILDLPGPASLQSGDSLLVSGPLGRHGVAVLSAREQLDFDPPPQSDSAPLFPAVARLQSAGIGVKALRDATRGGLSAVLHEWSECCGRSMQIEADLLPVTPEVRGVGELLGLDPLHIACEGTMVIAVESSEADRALAVLQQVAVGRSAARVGTVTDSQIAPVVIRRAMGQIVPLDEPWGSPLPRIC